MSGLNTYGSAGNQLTNEARTFYSMALIDRLLPKLPLFSFAQKQTIPEHTGGFGTGEIQFRKFAALTPNTTALTEGATPAAKSLSVTTVTTQLSQYGDLLKISDVMAAAGIDKVMAEATTLLGEAAGQALHTILLTAIIAGISNSTWPVGATTVNDLVAGDVLNSDLIKRAVRDLEARNVPKFGSGDGHYVMAIHPRQAYDLRGDSQWRNVSEYNGGAAGSGGPSVLSGELGQIHGVRFVQTTQITTTTNSGSVAYAKSFMFGPECFGMFDFASMSAAMPNPDTNLGIRIDSELPGKSSKFDPLGQWGYVAYKLAFAAKVIDPDRLQGVYTSYSS
jgi:N4-gp56 family major capsid protein